LIIETSLYYDARSEKHQMYGCHMLVTVVEWNRQRNFPNFWSLCQVRSTCIASLKWINMNPSNWYCHSSFKSEPLSEKKSADGNYSTLNVMILITSVRY